MNVEWYHLYFLFVTCFITNGSIHCYLDKHYWQKRFYSCDRSFLMKQYKRFFPTILFNLFLIAPFTYFSLQLFGPFESIVPFSFTSFLLQQVFFAFWFETFFYFSHLLLHTEPCMTYIHYKHHQMVHSIGFGAIYCHPIEMLISNFLPFALPIFIYPYPISFLLPITGKAHAESVLFWVFVAGTYIIFSHNGYAFPHSYPKHLVHHKNKFKNFGTLGIWDWFFHTDE